MFPAEEKLIDGFIGAVKKRAIYHGVSKKGDVEFYTNEGGMNGKLTALLNPDQHGSGCIEQVVTDSVKGRIAGRGRRGQILVHMSRPDYDNEVAREFIPGAQTTFVFKDETSFDAYFSDVAERHMPDGKKLGSLEVVKGNEVVLDDPNGNIATGNGAADAYESIIKSGLAGLERGMGD